MTINRRLSVFVFGVLATGLAVGPAFAATVTASINVSVTVVAGCQATPATHGFSSYAAATTNAASTVSVTCTQPTPYVVSLGAGTVPVESATGGKVTGPGSALPGSAKPSLAQQTISRGRTTGAGTAGGTDSGASQWQSALARTAAVENLAPGVYPDGLMVSITY